MEQLPLLRAATLRLVTTPTEDLPRVAGFIASSLASCPHILNGETTKSSDTSVPLHKLRTRLSSLLQDRTSAGRLTAAIVIKSVAEVARPNESTIWESWARGLVGCLNKPDPWEAKRVYLAATVRIFSLAQGFQTLQREVVTPLLPSFVTACLLAIRPMTTKQTGKSIVVTNPLLPTILRYWNELILEHSATFRPFVTRIKPICLSLVSDASTGTELLHVAIRLLASLHCCAPKASAANEWQLTITNNVKAAHDALDLIFRGVREEWASNETSQARHSVRHTYSQEPELTQTDTAGLGAWKGIHLGAIRVARLLQSTTEMLRCQSLSIAVPLGLLLDLTARIGAVTIPSQSGGAQGQLRLNPEVSKDEREALWADVPMLHIGSLALLSGMVEIHGQAICSLIPSIAEQVFDIFLAEGWHEHIRSQCYACLATILQTNSCASLQLDRQGIDSVCKSCCRDVRTLVPEGTEQSAESARNVQGESAIFQSASQGVKQKLSNNQVETKVIKNAQIILPLLLEKIPSGSLSHASRTEVDRTAILVNHERVMFASTMNPAGQKLDQRVLPSILPFFARAAAAKDMELEAIMRPRMPVMSETFEPIVEKEVEANGDPKTFPSRDMSIPQQDQLEKTVDHRIDQTIEAMMSTDKVQLAKYPEPAHPSHEIPFGKRDFTAMAETQIGVTEAVSKDQDPVNEPKRARVEGQNSITYGTSASEPQQTLGNGIAGAESLAAEPEVFGAVRTLPQVTTEKPIMYGKADLVPAQKDSDSDSDIPSINPELATDDEYEKEEDEEDELE